MTHPNKRRGNDTERELVHLAEKHGLKAKRAYASNGRSLGLTEDVDVVIGDESGTDAVEENVPVQCKRRKKIADYLTIPESCKFVYFRQDRGPGLALIRIEDLLDLL